jgi:hypothetical protein
MDVALPIDEEDHVSESESRLGRSRLVSTRDSVSCSEVPMCRCQPATSEVVRPSIRYSVQERGEAEAQRHKWIESEKAGRDLGNWAILCWIRYHWNGFLRERWLEHLLGRTYWYELDRDDFGLLQRDFQDSGLIDEILDRLKSGAENLDVLNWAIDTNQPMIEILEILEKLDINSRRIECLLQHRLGQS